MILSTFGIINIIDTKKNTIHKNILIRKKILWTDFYLIFIPEPAGVCSLSVSHVNITSATVAWAPAAGYFDFYKVTISNGSQIWTLDVSPHLQEVTVNGLWSGCSYNTTVQRFRNTIGGTAATITIHTGYTVFQNALGIMKGPLKLF